MLPTPKNPTPAFDLDLWARRLRLRPSSGLNYLLQLCPGMTHLEISQCWQVWRFLSDSKPNLKHNPILFMIGPVTPVYNH